MECVTPNPPRLGFIEEGELNVEGTRSELFLRFRFAKP